MSRLLSLLDAAAGEVSLHTPHGRWMRQISMLADELVDNPFNERAMTRIVDLLKASTGEDAIGSMIGQWRLAMSSTLDRIALSACSTGVVDRFTTLPAGARNPESIAVDSSGSFYVSTASPLVMNRIYQFEQNGDLAFSFPIPGATPAASRGRGLVFDTSGNLYLVHFPAGTVEKFSPPFSAASVPSQTYAVGGAGGINDFAWSSTGTLFISDSLNGSIYELNVVTGAVSTWITNSALQVCTGGFPPNGANGIAFNADFTKLYVANTGMNRILVIDTTTKAISRFAESVAGPDGIEFSSDGNLWVTANQGDYLVALDSNGRVVNKLGCFNGIGSDGAPIGLLFPSSMVFRNGKIYVTNFALPFGTTVGPSEPESDVTTFTVSSIPVPGIQPMHPLQR